MAALQRTRRKVGLVRELAFTCNNHDTESALPLSRKIYKMRLESPMSLRPWGVLPVIQELEFISPAVAVGLVESNQAASPNFMFSRLSILLSDFCCAQPLGIISLLSRSHEQPACIGPAIVFP